MNGCRSLQLTSDVDSPERQGETAMTKFDLDSLSIEELAALRDRATACPVRQGHQEIAGDAGREVEEGRSQGGFVTRGCVARRLTPVALQDF
jgi:hypothetical protein